MDPEVLRDLLQIDIRTPVTSDPHNVVAELLGIRLRHSDILPAQPLRTRAGSCHLSVQQTPRIRSAVTTSTSLAIDGLPRAIAAYR